MLNITTRSAICSYDLQSDLNIVAAMIACPQVANIMRTNTQDLLVISSSSIFISVPFFPPIQHTFSCSFHCKPLDLIPWTLKKNVTVSQFSLYFSSLTLPTDVESHSNTWILL